MNAIFQHYLHEHPMLLVMLFFSFLGAVVSSLKVLDETKDPIKALIAFLTGVMSVQALFAGYLKAAELKALQAGPDQQNKQQ